MGGDLPFLMVPTSHPERPFRGRVADGTFDVRLRTTYGNAFAAVCRGQIVSSPTGCVIRASIDAPSATLLMGLFVGLSAVGYVIGATFQRDAGKLLTAGGVLLFAVGLVTAGRLLARREAAAIVQHLRRVLQVDSGAPAA